MQRLPIWAAAVFLSVINLACVKPEGATHTISGKELFRSCDACHGKNGDGKAELAAPAIAGLPAWYVEAQLVKFRTGVRGGHPDDIEGLRMRPMSRTLMNEGEVKSVAEYVSTLPKHKPVATLAGGDAAKGKDAYVVCQACHGDKGQGNEALKAPPIHAQADWYLVSQLKKFKSGVRGANPNDVTGLQMRPMSLTLADEQAMKNVVAHVATLNP